VIDDYFATVPFSISLDYSHVPQKGSKVLPLCF